MRLVPLQAVTCLSGIFGDTLYICIDGEQDTVIIDAIDNLQATSNGRDLLFIEPENADTQIVFSRLTHASFSIHDQEDATAFPAHASVSQSPVSGTPATTPSVPSDSTSTTQQALPAIITMLLLSDS